MQHIDKKAISARFFHCFHNESHLSIAVKLGVSRQSVDQWKNNDRPIPWEKLKVVVDTLGLSWDWLIEGWEPRERRHINIERAEGMEFDLRGINARFLSLFTQMTQQEIADEVGVSRGAVQSWQNNRRKVPWERMRYAVHRKGVSWEWLIEGRDPKFLEAP